MIKNLRKRFIFAAMASTFGVLFVIMSILNVAIMPVWFRELMIR